VVVSRSETLRKALERALFARGAAVVALEALPSTPLLRGLLVNGLILLAPPAPWKLKGVDYLEAAEAESVRESVSTTLRELERRGSGAASLRRHGGLRWRRNQAFSAEILKAIMASPRHDCRGTG
jgi:hypothetical protein